MANEKQMDSELIEELQQRIEALNNEGVMDAGVIDGFLTAHALNPEHPSKHDIYPYIFSEEGDPAALPEDDRILELLDIRLNEIQAALAEGKLSQTRYDSYCAMYEEVKDVKDWQRPKV